MWRCISCCFRTNECLIKTVFFIHFTLTFTSLIFHEHSKHVVYNLFLFMALFGALFSQSRCHHFAQLAGLINIACIFFDVALFQKAAWIDRWQDNDLIPFYINFGFRFLTSLLLLQIGASYASSGRNDRPFDGLYGDSNNNTQYKYIDEEAGLGSGKLVDRTTEV